MVNQKERIKADIQKDIREIIQFEMKNENIGFLTITEIDVNSDLSYVKIYVSFLNHQKENFEKLARKKGFVKSSLAKRLKIRRAPEIVFELDNGYLEEEKISKLLEENK